MCSLRGVEGTLSNIFSLYLNLESTTPMHSGELDTFPGTYCQIWIVVQTHRSCVPIGPTHYAFSTKPILLLMVVILALIKCCSTYNDIFIDLQCRSKWMTTFIVALFATNPSLPIEILDCTIPYQYQPNYGNLFLWILSTVCPLPKGTMTTFLFIDSRLSKMEAFSPCNMFLDAPLDMHWFFKHVLVNLGFCLPSFHTRIPNF
jgi:hypothetical protein